MSNEAALRLFSIGHSNQPMEHFVDLLRQHRIEVVVDVRSQPYSRYAGQFNAEAIRSDLEAAGVRYLYLGKELGGRPDGAQFYDADGRVLYSQVSESSLFLSGIERLEKGAGQYRVAMMCSEENPMDCHRHLLVARVLSQRGVAVDHIRGDGQIQSEEEVLQEELRDADHDQLRLFDEPEEAPWKSKRPVL